METALQKIAKQMAEAIREWNRAKRERESWEPVPGQMPPVDLLGNARKANAMLTAALEEYEIYERRIQKGVEIAMQVYEKARYCPKCRALL